MPAAIDVQQHPRQRPALAPLAMHSPLALPRHQSRSRQRQLDPGVTQPDSVLLHQFLVKVQHIQIEVLLPIKLQHLLGQCHRNPPRRSLPPPLIKQPIVAKRLVAFPPPPHPAVADAYDLRRLPPSDPFRHRPYNHFLHFHRPLHRGLRVTNHASHGLLLSPPAKRTDHLLFQADISCATNRERKSGPRSEPETFSQTRQHLRRPGIYSARWPRLWPPGNTRCPPLLVIAVARRLLATSARNRGPLSFVRGKQRWHSWYPKRSCRHPEVVWPPPDVFPSQRRHSAPRRLQLIADGSPRDSASVPAPDSGLL